MTKQQSHEFDVMFVSTMLGVVAAAGFTLVAVGTSRFDAALSFTGLVLVLGALFFYDRSERRIRNLK